MPLPAIALPIILQAIKTFLPVGRESSESEKAESKQVLIENATTVTTGLSAVVGVAGVTLYASYGEAISATVMAVVSLVLFFVSEKGK